MIFRGFFYIGGLGHCGTKWLTAILNRPEHGIACFYKMLDALETPTENLVESTHLDLVEQAAHFGIMESVYRPYFTFFQEMGKLLPTGDAHSWPNHLLGHILKKLNAQKAIWLVRNGVSQVHSFDTWLDEVSLKSLSDYNQFVALMRADVETFGTPVTVSNDWEALSQFQQLCWWWSVQASVVQTINDVWQGPIHVARFEDLLTSDALPVLVQWVNPMTSVNRDELRGWANVDINQHTVGLRNPEQIWKSRWGQDKKSIFEGVCGSTMERFGYPRYG